MTWTACHIRVQISHEEIAGIAPVGKLAGDGPVMSTLHDEPLPQQTRRLMFISVASWNFPLPLPLLRFGMLVMFASLQFYLYTCKLEGLQGVGTQTDGAKPAVRGSVLALVGRSGEVLRARTIKQCLGRTEN